MKTGDPRQAAALGVVAVLAVGFLVSRLAPSGTRAVQAAPPVRSAHATRAVVEPTGLPDAVLGNPFSHARLAPKRAAQPAGSPSGGLSDLPLPGGSQPFRPNVQGLELRLTPAESAGETREEEHAPSRLTLTAILRVEQPVALISIDNETPVSFSAGDEVAEGVRLGRIGEGSVDLTVGKRTVRLGTGKTLEIRVGAGQ